MHYQRWRRNGEPTALFTQKQCSVSGCDSLSRSAGMCDKHYRRVKAHGDASIRLTMPAGICDEDGCDTRTFGKGKCQRHYYAVWVANGGRRVVTATMNRRRARLAGATQIDRSIGWPQLFESGDGRCYICGVVCNPEDYRKVVNRGGWMQKICGPTYPTLDHVEPLSRGGSHAANNVALACMKCNRNKSAKVARETKHCEPGQDAGKDRPR